MVKIIGDAVFLPLTRRHYSATRRYALIDIEDYERVSRSKWSIDRAGKSAYVCATSSQFLAAHHMALHAYVLRVQLGERVDHISGDTFDNRKQNLRPASQAQNAKNKRVASTPGKTSRFKGVCMSDGKWLANITSDGQRTFLGTFEDEESAAVAYDTAAIRLHGEFARTNAMMKLFEMPDPFVPDCSFADVYDRHAGVDELPTWKHRMYPANYDRRLTDRLKREYSL